MSRTYHADKAATVAPIVIAVLGSEASVEVEQRGVWDLLKREHVKDKSGWSQNKHAFKAEI